ncbi:phosphoacetylglucosamine mutase [Patella vulgata]|uniref:phosphoacetylglucosamine mutase n=1 Tax=Patella vulgata TaxID=6465 RepID=UPI0021805BC9|nr:phosphoacetylglucosamine mutase [Patella vulgata]
MEALLERAAATGLEKHPRKQNIQIKYGTAGFRTIADQLDHVIYRMGLLAVIASKSRKATIGVMITASHNPEEDNGVKLVDCRGEMMPAIWEKYATQLANAGDDEIVGVLRNILSAEVKNPDVTAKVIYGKDTRPSSIPLAQSLQDGIVALGGEYHDFGLLSTPQLHYLVVCTNTNGAYGQPTEEGYYNKLSLAFQALSKQQEPTPCKNYSRKLYVDAANGVGAPKLRSLLSHLSDLLDVQVFNDGSEGRLNYQCGADYVKVQQKLPVDMKVEAGIRCASFDGDADRIVYYYIDQDGKFNLLDGDKIATLVAGYLQELVARSGINLKLGLVQTAYANGSSTEYITDTLKVPVACVPTGVKHLHHKAQDFDIGVYFEANGHGTVLFSDDALKRIADSAGENSSLTSDQKQGVKHLSTVIDVINQTVGDALSDMLLVEIILRTRDWSPSDWNKQYIDLPNRQLKVKVKDRNVISTTDAERKVVTPDGLQAAIDTIVTGYKKGRSFVRPSGTEDVVRVYAEADTQVNVDKLAKEVGNKVYDLAGGIGDRP